MLRWLFSAPGASWGAFPCKIKRLSSKTRTARLQKAESEHLSSWVPHLKVVLYFIAWLTVWKRRGKRKCGHLWARCIYHSGSLLHFKLSLTNETQRVCPLRWQSFKRQPANQLRTTTPRAPRWRRSLAIRYSFHRFTTWHVIKLANQRIENQHAKASSQDAALQSCWHDNQVCLVFLFI